MDSYTPKTLSVSTVQCTHGLSLKNRPKPPNNGPKQLTEIIHGLVFRS